MVNFELHICYKEVTLIPSWPWLGKDSGSIHSSVCSVEAWERGRSHLETSSEGSELSLGEGGLGMSPEHAQSSSPFPAKPLKSRINSPAVPGGCGRNSLGMLSAGA